MDLCLHVVATTNDASMNCFLLSRESLEVVPRCWSWFACCWCRCHCCCAWSTTCIKSENIVLEKMWIRIHTYLFLSVGTEKASQRQKCDLLRMGLEPQVLWNWWWQQRSAIPHFTPTLKYWSPPKMLQKRATPRSFPLPPKNSLVIKKFFSSSSHFNPPKISLNWDLKMRNRNKIFPPFPRAAGNPLETSQKCVHLSSSPTKSWAHWNPRQIFMRRKTGK